MNEEPHQVALRLALPLEQAQLGATFHATGPVALFRDDATTWGAPTPTQARRVRP